MNINKKKSLTDAYHNSDNNNNNHYLYTLLYVHL